MPVLMNVESMGCLDIEKSTICMATTCGINALCAYNRIRMYRGGCLKDAQGPMKAPLVGR